MSDTPPLLPPGRRQSTVRRAEIVLAIATIVWATTFSVTRPLMEPSDPAIAPMGPFVLSGARLAIGATTILLYVLVARYRPVEHLPALRGAAHPLARRLRYYVRPSLILGALTYVGFTSQTVGMKYTTASVSALITGLSVVFVPLLVPLILRRRPGMKTLAAAMVCFIGTAFLTLLSSGGGGADQEAINAVRRESGYLGEWLTLLCAGTFAVQIITTEYVAIRYDALYVSIGALYVAMALAVATSFVAPGESWSLTGPQFAGALYLGVTGTGICFAMATWAQRHVQASRAAIIFGLEPFFGSLFAILFIGERFTAAMVSGAVLILYGIWLSRPLPGQPTPLDEFIERQRAATALDEAASTAPAPLTP